MPSTHLHTYKILPDALRPIVTEIVWFDYTTGDHHEDRQHSHHFHQIDVILEGEFTLVLDGQKNQIGRHGDAWIIPPLVWHGVNAAQHFRCCSFKFHIAPQYWPRLGTAFQRFHVPEHLCACSDALGKYKDAATPMVGEQAAAVISLCLIELLNQQPASHPEPDNLDEFRHMLWPLLEKIQWEPSIKWNTARMAQEMNLSPDYFSRCFHRVLKQTPQQYVMATAMRAAAASLLALPYTPTKKIAEEAGYATVQAFTRAFTQVFKLSPGAYRHQTIH